MCVNISVKKDIYMRFKFFLLLEIFTCSTCRLLGINNYMIPRKVITLSKKLRYSRLTLFVSILSTTENVVLLVRKIILGNMTDVFDGQVTGTWR